VYEWANDELEYSGLNDLPLLNNKFINPLFEDEKGALYLVAFTKRGRVHVEVIDNGCGIPAELKDKIFIPFFTTKENGTGIGLGLIKQIMRLHNGEIAVQSEPGRGTAFTLIF